MGIIESKELYDDRYLDMNVSEVIKFSFFFIVKEKCEKRIAQISRHFFFFVTILLKLIFKTDCHFLHPIIIRNNDRC